MSWMSLPPSSRMRCRSAPEPLNALSSSSTIVRRSSVSTEATVLSTLSSSSEVLTGIRVLSAGIV
jgi:hypothetical protein